MISWRVATNIGVIPARGGSVRVKNKNIREFCGQPMIIYPILAMQESGIFDRIIVSTDSLSIAEVARSVGAEVPFLRPSELADSTSSTIDVVRHALNEIGADVDSRVCCVYATNPFLTKELISFGFELLLESSGFDYVTPVVKYGFPIQRSLSLQNGCLTMTHPEYMYAHSQTLVGSYHETAQFWWAFAKTWLSRIGMQERVRGIVVPEWCQQDIDTEDDWIGAEMKYQLLKLRPDWPLSKEFLAKNTL